jgi:protein involved in polysaccharide export with SLBB domain
MTGDRGGIDNDMISKSYAIANSNWRGEATRTQYWKLLIITLVVLTTMTFASLSFGQGIGRYILGSGDKIKIVVFGHSDLSGEYEIDGSGNVSLPLIKEVKAVGLTIQRLEQLIISKLRPDYLKNPRVNVEVLNYRPFYIIGEIKKPGSYPYVAGMSVVNAVALAGGYTYRAKEGKVLLTRSKDGKQVPANHQTTVMPGDVIEVPERFF